MKNSPKSILLDEMYTRRNTYTKYAKSLYKYLEIRNNFKPTIDVSKRYKKKKKKYLLSCEIAALRMVVEAKSGKYVSEETIIQEIPHYPAPYKDGVW